MLYPLSYEGGECKPVGHRTGLSAIYSRDVFVPVSVKCPSLPPSKQPPTGQGRRAQVAVDPQRSARVGVVEDLLHRLHWGTGPDQQ
jgi:hypothetical protein